MIRAAISQAPVHSGRKATIDTGIIAHTVMEGITEHRYLDGKLATIVDSLVIRVRHKRGRNRRRRSSVDA